MKKKIIIFLSLLSYYPINAQFSSQGQIQERALLDKPLSEITIEDLKDIQSRIAILEQALKSINNAIMGTQEIELIVSLQLKRNLYEKRLAELELKLLNYDLMQTGGSLMDIDLERQL